MRPLRITAIALIAAGLVLAGCGGDEEPAADEATTAASTPAEDDTATPDETTEDDDTGDDDTGEVDEVGDFPEVDGFTLVQLPASASQAFGQAVQGTPQIEGFEGRLVETDGNSEAGVIIRIGVDPDAAGLDKFEDKFLPGFASGIAGTTAKPDFEEINGVNVVKIGTPDGAGTAYAWIEDSVATVLVFQDVADAQAFAEGALD
jgi:hypothetical protein